MAMRRWLENRWSDLRWAVRAARRSPGTTALAVLSLALGIGANTAIFSLVDTLLLKRLPVQAPQELHLVAIRSATPRLYWNYPDYVAFRDRVKGLAGLAAASGASSMGLQVDEGGRPAAAELAQTQFVSGSFFTVLGVRPALGRLLNAADDRAFGAAPWAVLGYQFWQRRFAADPRVIGRTVRVNGYPLTVIGVAQRGFQGDDPTAKPDLFVPMVMHTEVQHVPVGIWNTRHYWWFRIVGRLPAGTPGGPIDAQLTSVFRVQEEEERKASPDRRAGNRAPSNLYLLPAATGYSSTRSILRTPLLVLMAVVGLVLLIACANVANIMLARGAARRHEIAIRLAVGASRSRIMAQLLCESFVLSALGAAAGVLLAWLGITFVIDRFLPTTSWNQVSIDVSPDLRVLAFTIGVSLLTALLAGLAPGWQATRPSLVPALKDDVPGRASSSRAMLRRVLVVAQVALSLLLVIGAALFARTLGNLRDLDAGFRRDQTLVAFVEPGRAGYKGQRSRDFYERLRAGVERLPGVRSVSLATITPLAGMRWNGDFAVEGYQFKAGEERYVDMNAVGPRYFETVGIPLLLGREFREEDNPTVTPDPPQQLRSVEPPAELPGPRYVIVSESFAKRFLAGGSPIGRRLSMTQEYDATRAYEVVGVVKDARYFELREGAVPMVYVVSWRLGSDMAASLCVRASVSDGLEASIRRVVAGIDPGVPLLRTRTIEQQIDADIVQERLMASLAGFFGVLALLLACVGLYGVISYLVAQRTREIGIRVALGASRGAVLRLVTGDAAVMVALGAVIGVGAAAGLARFVRSLLYGVTAQDPSAMVLAVLVLAVVAALAVLVPARRALRVQPSVALRCE